MSTEMLLNPSVRVLSNTQRLHSFTKHRIIVDRASFWDDSRLGFIIMAPELNDQRRKAIWLPDPKWSIHKGMVGFKSEATKIMDDFYIIEPGKGLRGGVVPSSPQ